MSDSTPVKSPAISARVPFVIGAGLPRTGTKSFETALNGLGYKTVHMGEYFDGRASLEPFFELAKKERATGRKDPDLARAAAQSVIDLGYTAVADFPNDFLYPEFMELVPDAKVVLTVRKKPADWRNSVIETIGQITFPFSKPPFSFSPFFRGFVDHFDPWCWERMGGIADLGEMNAPESIVEFEHKMEEAYTQYVAVVKATVPAEKLLVFHPSDGYPPLCTFLGISEMDCPKGDFPYVNDKAEAIAFIHTFTLITQLFWPFVGVLVLAIVWGFRKIMAGRKGGKAKKS